MSPSVCAICTCGPHFKSYTCGNLVAMHALLGSSQRLNPIDTWYFSESSYNYTWLCAVFLVAVSGEPEASVPVILTLSWILQSLLEFLQTRRVDVNIRDNQGEGPIHKIVKKKRRDRVELLITLLSNSNADVNFETTRSMTALHFAVEVRKIWMLAFPAWDVLTFIWISL